MQGINRVLRPELGEGGKQTRTHHADGSTSPRVHRPQTLVGGTNTPETGEAVYSTPEHIVDTGLEWDGSTWISTPAPPKCLVQITIMIPFSSEAHAECYVDEWDHTVLEAQHHTNIDTGDDAVALTDIAGMLHGFIGTVDRFTARP